MIIGFRGDEEMVEAAIVDSLPKGTGIPNPRKGTNKGSLQSFKLIVVFFVHKKLKNEKKGVFLFSFILPSSIFSSYI